MTLRPHQQAVVNVCRDILNGAKIKDIVICATPGSGKSFLPVILADNLLPIFADKLCWVVPRNSLKYQGEEEFTTPRWGTTKRLRAAMNGEDLSRGLDGYVTTYQSIGADPLCHSREFSKYRYILVLDEFHHIMNGSEWHKALTSLVEKAALVVKMSGTPARGDGERIAFYNPQKPGYMIRYSRSEAIRDGAILPIHFQLVDGEAEWKETDGRQGASALSGEESAKALFTALRTEFAYQLLDKALKAWTDISYNYREAKLLVVAPNIELAKQYENYIHAKGITSRIATSDDTPEARRNIEDFKRHVFGVLVTVAMAYEGLNVPSISVICCLSHIRSVPWLEQCFARANRLAPGKREAVVIAPADWAFKKAVEMIEMEQLTPLNKPAGQGEIFDGGAQERGEGSGEAKPWIVPLSSRASIDGTANAKNAQTGIPPCSPSDAEKILRKNINNVITAYLNKQAYGNKQAWNRMIYRRMKLICDKPIKDMNQKELVKVWTWVKSIL